MRSLVLIAAALVFPASAQETSPVTQWISSHAIRLATPVAGHGFDRSIGSMYPENQPYALMLKMKAPEAFDVLLYVAETTAARKNPPPGK